MDATIDSAQFVCRGGRVSDILDFCRARNGAPNDLIYQMATFMPTKIPEVINTLVEDGILNPARVREIATCRFGNHGNALYLLCLQKIDNQKRTGLDEIKIDFSGIDQIPGFEEFLATQINPPIETDQMLRSAQFLVDNGVDVNCGDIANPEHRNYAKKTLLESAYESDDRGGTNFFWTKFLIRNGARSEDITVMGESDANIVRKFNEVRDSMQNPSRVPSSAFVAEFASRGYDPKSK